MRANLKVIKTNITVIYKTIRFYKILQDSKILYLKYKFGQIGPKIKISLNLHENWDTIQFEDGEYKYDMIKGFFNSNPDLEKYLSNIQNL